MDLLYGFYGLYGFMDFGEKKRLKIKKQRNAPGYIKTVVLTAINCGCHCVQLQLLLLQIVVVAAVNSASFYTHTNIVWRFYTRGKKVIAP